MLKEISSVESIRVFIENVKNKNSGFKLMREVCHELLEELGL